MPHARRQTVFSSETEAKFRTWYAKQAAKWDLNPDPDDPAQAYDYRAAFRAGAEPDPKTGHWPSEFKAEGHPNLIVGGFDTQTGQYVPGHLRAGPRTLAAQGWDPETAGTLAALAGPMAVTDPVPSHGSMPSLPLHDLLALIRRR